MSFWRRITGRDGGPNFEGETSNSNAPSDVGPDYTPGDPHGVELTGERGLALPFPVLQASPWSGWPEIWSTPDWTSQLGMRKLVDIAFACIDLNASVLASFPVYRLRNGQILPPMPSLINPDPSIYTSWSEFAKQLFWDYQLGEAFVLPMQTGSDNYPTSYRVVPPWLINIELRQGIRNYNLGSVDVTSEILHIRNISNTADAHGHSPLEMAGARMVTAGLLQRYIDRLAETGGTPHYWLDVPGRRLDKQESADLLDSWVESRIRHAGEPSVLSGGVGLKQTQAMSARDLSLLELAQFSEARIAIMLGVPPFLVGLPMAMGESMTYQNVESVFGFHDRSSLRPKANAVMEALSGWLLPRGQCVELNRDEYSRPGYLERAQGNALYLDRGVLTVGDVRAMERFETDPSVVSPTAPASLTGAEVAGATQPPNPAKVNANAPDEES